jgi:hypothetical protein
VGHRPCAHARARGADAAVPSSAQRAPLSHARPRRGKGPLARAKAATSPISLGDAPSHALLPLVKGDGRRAVTAARVRECARVRRRQLRRRGEQLHHWRPRVEEGVATPLSFWGCSAKRAVSAQTCHATSSFKFEYRNAGRELTFAIRADANCHGLCSRAQFEVCARALQQMSSNARKVMLHQQNWPQDYPSFRSIS